MKKVLVWIGGDLFNFPLTYYLKKKCDLEIYAIADVTLHLKKYLENQKLIKFNNLWFFQESASLNLKNPDLSYLKEIEKKFDLNLWELINTERYFDPKINTYHKFSKEEILCILENECKFFEKILFDVKPEFLIMYMPYFHYDFILYQMCKKLGIKVLLLGSARGFSNTSIISEDYDKLPKHDIEKIDEKNFTSFKQLQSYLKKDNWYEENQTFKNNFMSSKKSLFKAFFTYLFSKNHNEKYYTYFGAGKIKVILRTIWVNLLEKYRFSYMEKNSLKELNISEPFIFFPLHVYPEGSFVLNAPYLTNQLEIIKHISKSIPINYTLVVKEHPLMNTRGWRELSFYNEIINLPNVKLLSTSISPDEILKKMKLIITITSTAGLEAAFYEKPCIVLVDTMYDEIPSVIKLKKFDDLSLAIKQSLIKKIKPEDLNSYINSIEKKSFKCDIIGLSNNLMNELFYNGFLSDVKITDEKLLKFIENNSEQYKILATNYLKSILSND
tara:strand:+ start:3029 stop:4525 length:1497 start_codon:yes stop_codon:yes gene_type:complete